MGRSSIQGLTILSYHSLDEGLMGVSTYQMCVLGPSTGPGLSEIAPRSTSRFNHTVSYPYTVESVHKYRLPVITIKYLSKITTNRAREKRSVYIQVVSVRYR